MASRDDNPLQMNPRATALAKEFNVLYDEVQQWFDRGYPLGEIERAYRMGHEKDAEVSDILAMRDAGLDWRQVDKALETLPDLDDEDDDDRPRDRGRSSRR